MFWHDPRVQFSYKLAKSTSAFSAELGMTALLPLSLPLCGHHNVSNQYDPEESISNPRFAPLAGRIAAFADLGELG